MRHKNKRILSKSCQLVTFKGNIISLSSFDDNYIYLTREINLYLLDIEINELKATIIKNEKKTHKIIIIQKMVK